jgi:DNA-binding IclR family transcriptional regulator
MESPVPESRTQAVDRAIDVLDALKDAGRPVGVRALASTVGVSPGTMHRLLSTLKERGLVQQDEESRAYWLGWGLVDYSNLLLRASSRIAEIAAPYAERLSDLTRETVTVQVPAGVWCVCVFEINGSHELQRRVGVGRRIPLYAGASARSILAFLPKDIVERVLSPDALVQVAPNTIVDPRVVREHLAEIAAARLAWSQEESALGIAALASPLLRHDGTAAGSLSISGPVERWNRTSMAAFEEPLGQAAAEISALLGYRVPASTDLEVVVSDQSSNGG